MRVSIILIGLLALGATLIAGRAQAQIDDHMRCYKIKDTQKLKGTVDIDTAQFGLAPARIRDTAFRPPTTRATYNVAHGRAQAVT